MAKKIVAGNWKMHKTLEEAQSLLTEIRGMVRDETKGKCEVVVCPPSIALHSLSRLAEGSQIKVGAQNCHHNEQGAFTGEISASMISSTGASYVITGHSERRQYFAETNDELLLKNRLAIKNGLNVIYCVGETLSQRQNHEHFKIIQEQIEKGVLALDRKEFSQISIAYEPVWAIGTGVTASPIEAQEIHAFIRNLISNHFTSEIADDTAILYGGSVKADNAKELFSQKDIDGGLIGGASLKARDFIEIIHAMEQVL